MPSREQVAEVLAPHIDAIGQCRHARPCPFCNAEAGELIDALMSLFEQAWNEALEEAAGRIDRQQGPRLTDEEAEMLATAARIVRARIKTGGGGSSG